MATRWWRGPDGREIEVGDRDAVAELLGITVKTWARYRERTWRDPPPRPVTINPTTRRDEWSLDEIRAWHSRRRGPGRRPD